MKQPVVILTGPTGSGKSSLLYSLAPRLPLSIIGADSRQVYQGLPVITAQPTVDEMARHPHHLIAFLSLDKHYSAGAFAADASRLINQAHIENRLPVIIGGTFYYIKTLWDGAPREIEIPQDIREYCKKLSIDELRMHLRKIDETAANAIQAGDTYRLQRALEVSLAMQQSGTGKFSDRRNSGGIYEKYSWFSLSTDLPRDMLYERINHRTREMFSAGSIAEIREVIQNGYGRDDPGLNTIGVRELLNLYSSDEEFLEKTQKNQINNNTLQTAIELTSRNTRRYAKRQLTWFRHESRLKTFDPLVKVSLLSETIEAALMTMQ